MLNINVTIINLVKVIMFIVDMYILLNFSLLWLLFQFSSLIFINRVDRVIRIYIYMMISVNKIIIVGSIIIWLLSSVWTVAHFGKNPNKGGIPLKERKFNENSIFVLGFEFID